MTNNITISCILNTNNPTAKLGFEGWIDDQRFINIDHVQEEQKILIEIPDDEADHELKFVLKNKTIDPAIAIRSKPCLELLLKMANTAMGI